MKLAGACLAVALAVLAATAEPARACSCALPDARAMLPRADGAIVARLVARRVEGGRATHVFRVLESVKGRFGGTLNVVSAASGAACGLELRVGQTTGLFLQRRGGRWESSLCYQVDADRLRAAARPLPPPNGRGPAAFLVAGRYGPYRSLALDARGRTLGYGRGAGRVAAFGVCPGSRLALELLPGRRAYLAVRALPRMRLLSRRPLGIAAGSGYEPDVSCRARDGSEAAVFVTRPFRSGADSRVLLLRRGRPARTVWRGRAQYGRVGPRLAYVAAGRGDRLVRVALATGRTTPAARTRPARGVAIRPDGRAVAVVSELWVTLVRLDSQAPRLVRIRLPACCGGRVVWLADGRAALLSYGRPLILDAGFRRVGRVRGWFGLTAAARGARLVGVDFRGRLVDLPTTGGAVRVLRDLPGPTAFAMTAVPPPT